MTIGIPLTPPPPGEVAPSPSKAPYHLSTAQTCHLGPWFPYIYAIGEVGPLSPFHGANNASVPPQTWTSWPRPTSPSGGGGAGIFAPSWFTRNYQISGYLFHLRSRQPRAVVSCSEKWCFSSSEWGSPVGIMARWLSVTPPFLWHIRQFEASNGCESNRRL